MLPWPFLLVQTILSNARFEARIESASLSCGKAELISEFFIVCCSADCVAHRRKIYVQDAAVPGDIDRLLLESLVHQKQIILVRNVLHDRAEKVVRQVIKSNLLLASRNFLDFHFFA